MVTVFDFKLSFQLYLFLDMCNQLSFFLETGKDSSLFYYFIFLLFVFYLIFFIYS